MGHGGKVLGIRTTIRNKKNLKIDISYGEIFDFLYGAKMSMYLRS